jgi:crotonobetainyl-CoA:carnitine CoA-transferase CaiB-like acyl-CoA transferase
VPPLEGVTVVSLEQAVAAPFATRQLADLGARVIKVERPGVGDFARGYDRTVHGEASYFVWLNRGKESIELDIKDPADREVLDRIIGRTDVLVQNLVPGAVDRLGLDAGTMRAARPELIHCSVSGYGPDGPYRAKKAYDLLVQCETGMVAATGTPLARASTTTRVPLGDISEGKSSAGSSRSAPSYAAHRIRACDWSLSNSTGASDKLFTVSPRSLAGTSATPSSDS